MSSDKRDYITNHFNEEDQRLDVNDFHDDLFENI